MAKGNDVADTEYLVSSTVHTTTLVPTFTLVNDNSCTLTTTYQVREYGTAAWFTAIGAVEATFSSFLTANLPFSIDVASTDPNSFNPAKIYEIMITYSASTTTSIAASNSDTFLLTMKDECIDVVMVCTDAVDFTQTISADPTATVD